MQEEQLIEIIYCVAYTLSKIQSDMKVAHRDIKPHNILQLPNNMYKLTDFGVARQYSKENYSDNSITIIGIN